MSEPEPVEYATQEVSDAWRTYLPIWYGLVSDMHKDPSTAGFARYIADDQERVVQRAYAIAEVRAQETQPLTAATIAGHRLADTLIEPHQDAITELIALKAPVQVVAQAAIEGAGALSAIPEVESTLSMEAVPGEPNTFA